jgi:F-type H+-transporting ATPase subunit b
MNRARVVVSGGAVVGVTLLASAPAGWAQQQEEPPGPAKELSHEAEECIHLLEEGKEPDACQEAPNPILPATNELVWGSISFVVLFVLLWRFAFPALRRGLEARAERIRTSLDEAERARTEAQSILDQYQRQLADARNESARIIEEARQTADRLRADLRSQADADVAQMRERAQEEIAAMVDRARTDLQAGVRELTLELAEKVVERNLDRDTNLAMIDNFINEVGASRS